MWTPQLGPSSGTHIYRQIVKALTDDMSCGRLPGGTRLPPHRDLADQLGVARGTIAKAYTEAEKLGLVRSGVGSGTFVLAPDAEERPYSTLLEPPVIFNDLTTNYPLPGVDPDPADAFRQLAVRPDRMALMRYQSHLGMRRHRRAGVQWAKRLGVETDADGVIVCAGAQHALFVTLAHLTEPGDAIGVEEWSYPGLHGIAETLRLKLVAVTMDRGGLRLDSLDRVCQRQRLRALICMPTAHNPTGAVMSATRRKGLARLARRHDLRLVEDAANRLLVPDPPPPLFHYAPERTFVIASTSKILGAGLRVAFLVTSAQEVSALARHVWATQWMVSPVGVEVVTIWLEQGVADETIRRKRAEARRRQKLARRLLQGHTLQAHTHVLHLWLKLPPPWQADQLVAAARLHNIGVTPSSAFWMRATTAQPAIRIALGGVDDRRALRHGLQTLAQILGRPKRATDARSRRPGGQAARR